MIKVSGALQNKVKVLGKFSVHKGIVQDQNCELLRCAVEFELNFILRILFKMTFVGLLRFLIE